MVSLVTTETTVRMLIERLNWPVRLAKWRTACELGVLLSSEDYSELATEVYLDWLSSRQFESEIASALAVLFCTPKSGLPSFETVADSTSKPSVLADLMLQAIYGPGQIKGEWKKAYSSEVPRLYEPETYFLNNKSVCVPSIFNNQFEKLEKETGFPFIRQWAFEWQKLMESTKAPYSSHPYYFVEPSLSRSGIFGQFSQRQCDVYQSAYLRTLACAVDCEGIDLETAAFFALHALPLNRGLEQLNVTERPDWLCDIPEKCFSADGRIELLVRKLIKLDLRKRGMRTVALRTPVSPEVAEFSDLSVRAVLASKDFVPDLSREHIIFTDDLIWHPSGGISIEGNLPQKDIKSYIFQGITGACIPLCLNLCPYPIGLWLTDYFLKGVLLPAPYVFNADARVSCRNDRIEIVIGGRSVASWKFWHDCWTPLYALEGGSTRCGMLTELREDEISKAQERYGMKLGWLVELNIWKQAEEHEPFESSRRREFFFDT